MKAITIHQPWASAIVLGIKKVETRSWRTRMTGRVAIHASSKPPLGILTAYAPELQEIFQAAGMPSDAYPSEVQKAFRAGGITQIADLPTGCVLGTVSIAGCYSTDHIERDMPWLATAAEKALGHWGAGRYGIVMDNPLPLTSPIPARGQQGFWEWDESTLRRPRPCCYEDCPHIIPGWPPQLCPQSYTCRAYTPPCKI